MDQTKEEDLDHHESSEVLRWTETSQIFLKVCIFAGLGTPWDSPGGAELEQKNESLSVDLLLPSHNL